MALPIEMLDLSAAIIIAADQVRGIVFTQDSEGLLKLVLFNVTVGCKVAAGRVSCNKVAAGEES